eukprot:gene39979-52772_t
MLSHAADTAQHITGLLEVVSGQQSIIQELSEAQCEAAVEALRRELAYPLYEMLADRLDCNDYQAKSDISDRLISILRLIGAPSYHGDDEATNCKLLRSRITKQRAQENRHFIFSQTEAVKILSNILCYPFDYTKPQLEYTLKVLYSLAWDASSSDLTWEDCHVPFEEALTTLGKCLVLFFSGVGEKLEIIPIITDWVPNHMYNEDYMCGVATVMAGFLKVIRLERVLVTDVFKVI